MKDEELVKFNAFRKLSLKNADDFLRGAELLLPQKLNHISYHLAILSLEEVGKIFMFYIKLHQKESWDKENAKIEMDDHIRKIFFAIWGPSIGKELITKDQLKQSQFMATKLHGKRLATLYGDVNDVSQSAHKLTDEEVNSIVEFSRARLELAKVEGEVNEEIKIDGDMAWLMKFMEIPEKRNNVFGKQAQEKLIEFDDVHLWIQWLRVSFENEQKNLSALMQKEIERSLPLEKDEITPKWEITFTVISPSHSIRAKELNAYNARNPFIKVYPGKDKHAIVIKNILGTSTPITKIWEEGWLTCKLFVAALNVAAHGIFYWNTVVDIDRYYDYVTDLASNSKILARLEAPLVLNWRARRMYLTKEILHLACLVYEYLISLNNKAISKPIMKYMSAVAMLSKTDIHLRLEFAAFELLYETFCEAVQQHELCDDEKEIVHVGYNQIDGLIQSKENFDRVIKLAQIDPHAEVSHFVTLEDVFSMKEYCEYYFITVAIRNLKNDKSLKLSR